MVAMKNESSMIKRLTYIVLVTVGLATLATAVNGYLTHWDWLEARRLVIPARVGVFILGIIALLMPIHLRVHWNELTAVGLIREYLSKAGMIAGTLTVLGAAIGLVFTIIMLPLWFDQPALFLPWLLFAAPLARVGQEMYAGTYPATLEKALWGWAYYSFYLYFMLVLMIGGAIIGFLLFPAGFFLQFMGGVDLIVRIFWPEAAGGNLVCGLLRLGETGCRPAPLIAFHASHLILALAGLRYGEAIFNWFTDQYAKGLRWFEGKLREE
jgi:hypothetical protein